MRIKSFLTGATALALLAAPTMASAANPAASLSVVPAGARASANAGDSNLAGGGGIFAVLALGAIFVAAIIIGESGNDNNSPKSP